MRILDANKDLIYRNNLIWLIVAQACCIFPLLLRLPFWISAVWFFAVFWRVQIHRTLWHFPSFWLKLALGIGSGLGIYLTYQGVAGVEPMVGFLVCSFILKVIEMRTKKDAMIILFIGFIAIAAQFLFAQGLVNGLYGVFSVFVLLSAWQAAFVTLPLNFRTHLKRGLLLLGQSLPFMLILFVIMPRLGPLWSVPTPHGKGKTGFSETMKLGDVGDLVQSPAVAFRVNFISTPPPVNAMYWRGLALDMFDGKTWSASVDAYDDDAWSMRDVVSDFEYSVIMEPHQYRWLFSLGFPVSAESSQINIRRNQQGLLAANSPITDKAEYRVRAVKRDPDPSNLLGAEQRSILLRLPRASNPEARALADRWRGQGLSQEQMVQTALAQFNQGFTYTLRPPLLAGDTIDQFLFQTQRGFCEHFASSFVFLMRAAGIPARVVVGYQGGELNRSSQPLDSYYLVRQSDAHAWAEIWLDHQGWQSVDPTAVVAPSRIELGLEESLTQDEKQFVGGRRPGWLTSVAQGFDMLEYSWTRWVLNYNSDSQQGLLERLLGANTPARVGAVFAALCGLFFAGIMLLNVMQKRGKVRSAHEKLVQPILRKLQRRGFERRSGETLTQLTTRIAKAQPQLSKSLKEVDRWYSRAVYGDDPNAIKNLRAAVKTFKW